jgi:tetratricopeptide (TPR) repeat protein
MILICTTVFAFEHAGIILSKDYLERAQSLDTKEIDSRAVLTIAVGLKFKETIQPNYKTWFINLKSSLEGANLPDDIALSLAVVDSMVSTSTVSALNMLGTLSDQGLLLEAVSLRLHYYDWLETSDPRSSKIINSLAVEILGRDPGQYLPHKAMLDLYSSSSHMKLETLNETRKGIFENGLGSLLGSDLIESEFSAGMFETVIEDFHSLVLNDPVSIYYAASAYLRMGQEGEGRKMLESIELGKLPPRLASSAALALGDGLFQEGRMLESIELFQQSIRFWPENSRAVRNLGMAYYEIHDREYYDLARFYLQLSGYEAFDESVSAALKELRRRVIFEMVLVTVVPIGVIVVLALFLLEYISKRRRASQMEKALRNNGGFDGDKGSR